MLHLDIKNISSNYIILFDFYYFKHIYVLPILKFLKNLQGQDKKYILIFIIL